MGKLPEGPIEVRLAATLLLLLMGVANFFGAWQVRQFASFTPAGTAATVAPEGHHDMTMICCQTSAAEEKPVDIKTLDEPHHVINRELLVQDTHVHVPVYALSAGLLALIVFGLRLLSRLRVALVSLLFAAPLADFAGLWGAHLFPRAGSLFGFVAVAGGFAMGAAYLVILVLTLWQCWFSKNRKEISRA
jgi:hypothetical protein